MSFTRATTSDVDFVPEAFPLAAPESPRAGFCWRSIEGLPFPAVERAPVTVSAMETGDETACTWLFVTIGAEGILVFTREGMGHVPGIPVAGPIDIVGAGDSVMAGIVSALCAGAAPGEAALVGNLVASITVQHIGTTGTASRQQVFERFREFSRTLNRRRLATQQKSSSTN